MTSEALRKILIAGAAILALDYSLAACATTPSEHLRAGQAVATTTASLDAAAKTVDGLIRAGVTTQAENRIIAKVAPEARDLLKAASDAYFANKDASAEQNAMQAAALVAQIVTILAAHNVEVHP